MPPSDHHDDRPSKRSRNHLESPPTEICKHESLYFENGNIVLLSLPENNVITAFKVFMDFLVLHSPVFEGMLSLPPPKNAEEYDNVPLVRLHDGATHLFQFLKALYEPMGFPQKRDFYLSSGIVESTFMLAKKYQCDKLLHWMCDTLSDIWPKDLTAWDNHPMYYQDEMADRFFLLSDLPEPCFAIRLAREYDVPSILPAAFYHLHCLSLATSVVPRYWGLPTADYMGVEFDPTPNFSHLSPDDSACLARGNARLQKFIIQKKAEELPVRPAPRCHEKEVCSARLESFARYVKLLDCDPCTYLDELTLLQNYIENLQHGLCPRCSVVYIKLLEKHRSNIWATLPKFFGLKNDSGWGFTTYIPCASP